MLPDVAIDASNFWLLEGGEEVDVAFAIIEKMLAWTKLSSAIPVRCMISSCGLDKITEIGLFPAEPHFAAVLKQLNLEKLVSARSLASSVARFLSSVTYIEETSGLSDFAISGASTTSTMVASITSDHLKTVSIEDMFLFSYASSLGKNAGICMGMSRLNVPVEVAQITAHVDIIVQDQSIASPNIQYTDDLPCLSDPSQYFSALRIIDIWNRADQDLEVEIAIYLQAQAIAGIDTPIQPFRVGSEFMSYLHRSQAIGGAYSQVVLTKCAHALIAPDLLGAKPFRVNEAPTSAQRTRTRDRATAWRAHVTKGHEALRLMFWRLSDGAIEFSCVRNKFDTAIDEGNSTCKRVWWFE